MENSLTKEIEYPVFGSVYFKSKVIVAGGGGG